MGTLRNQKVPKYIWSFMIDKLKITLNRRKKQFLDGLLWATTQASFQSQRELMGDLSRYFFAAAVFVFIKTLL